MIETFENYTQKIPEYLTLTVIPFIVEYLKENTLGETTAIKSNELTEIIYEKTKISISDVILRRCIKYIQANALVNWIVATQKGFFYTEDISVVQKQIKSLKSRESAIRNTREHIEKSLLQYA